MVWTARRRSSCSNRPGLAVTVAESLVDATHGNPLALIEVPPLLSADQRSGATPLEDPLPLGRELDRAFRRRLDALAEAERRAVLVAACAGDATADVVYAALARIKVELEALDAAEDAGELVALDGSRIVFCHPLQRAAAMRSASPADRRWAHREIAAVLPDGSNAARVAPRRGQRGQRLGRRARPRRSGSGRAASRRPGGGLPRLRPRGQPRAR